MAASTANRRSDNKMESFIKSCPQYYTKRSGSCPWKKIHKAVHSKDIDKKFNSHTFTIGAKINGMKNVLTNDERTAKQYRFVYSECSRNTRRPFPMALFCFDFASHINMNGTTRVAPAPPIVVTNICRPEHATLEARCSCLQ